MEKLRIGIGGSAANPPQLGHRHMVEGLLKSSRFDEIYWIPSGVRPDKDGFVSPDNRVAMTLLTFRPSGCGKEKQNLISNLMMYIVAIHQQSR